MSETMEFCRCAMATQPHVHEEDQVMWIPARDKLPAREALSAWIDRERAVYADKKYAEGSPQRERLIEAMGQEGYGQEWANFVSNYLTRAELFGINTRQGRQAMGKAIITLMHCLETAIEVHGPMPKPGVPSGEIQ